MGWKSLRFRIAAVIVVVTLILGLGETGRARADLARIGRSELEKRAVNIARDLALQHADQILVNDFYRLHTLINAHLLSNPDLRYIFILDAQGQVLVDSFPQGLPPDLREANVPTFQESHRSQRLRTTDGVVIDVAMPAMEGRAGVVRVGFLEGPLWAQINRQTRDLLALTLAITLLGAGAGFALGTLLTRPLSQLVRVTQAVARGDLRHKAPVKGSDETEKLARSFNHMTDALTTSRDELLRRNQELAALNAVSVAVGQSLELETVLDAALGKVLELMKLPAGWVFLQEGRDERLLLAARRGVPADLFKANVEAITDPCTCQQMLLTDQAQLVQDVQHCPRLNRLETGNRLGACHICVPLRSGERTVGIMNVVCQTDQYPSKKEDLDLLTAIGYHIGVAVENARLYRELQHTDRLRRQLVKKLIYAQEEERRRIARELHDQYAQALSALSVSIEATKRALPKDRATLGAQMDSVRALTARTVDQTYDLIFDLRPTTLDDLGLVPAVRWYLESHLGPLGVEFRLETESLPERLSPEMETACYRVVQEALSNVARHAQARRVRISLETQDGRFRGVVEDDGQGFDLEALQRSSVDGRGIGLLGMQERVELLDGRFHIETAPGQGTRVLMELPIGSLPAERAEKVGGGD